MYPYGLIGNCHSSALISTDGSVDWLCWPRPDSEPVFGRMLDPDGGHFSVDLALADSALRRSRQSYERNTNILVTELRSDKDDYGVRITDFFPRFEQMGRVYRPTMLVRKIESIGENARVRLGFRPVDGWTKTEAKAIRGNSHLRYDVRGEELRLTTNASLTSVTEGQDFVLQAPVYCAVTWGVGVEGDLVETCERFLLRTRAYWETWVKHCNIPPHYQHEVIRSALTLKLHCYEDTGAILAALTTSLPESPGRERNWDYRFCWLRDAFFVLTAFRNLGHFEEMEGFLKYFLDIAFSMGEELKNLAPVYNLSHQLPLPERSIPNWSGYAASSPVRVNNQAAEHVQNDAYGEMILALAPIYFDERFASLRSKPLEKLLLELGKLCVRSLNEKDAGLWEIRGNWQIHSFTHLLCWAGLERLRKIAARHPTSALSGFDWEKAAEDARKILMTGVHGGVLMNGPHDATHDASLALTGALGFPETEIARRTVLETARALEVRDGNGDETGFFYRYRREDDFGKPDSAFVICSFWMIQALAQLGEKEQAERIMRQVLKVASPLGLISEHFDPVHGRQLGNFPQAYSHVGLINAAFAVSPPWDQIL